MTADRRALYFDEAEATGEGVHIFDLGTATVATLGWPTGWSSSSVRNELVYRMPSTPLMGFFVAMVLGMLGIIAHVLPLALQPPIRHADPRYIGSLLALLALLAAELLLSRSGALSKFEQTPASVGLLLVPLLLVNIGASCCTAAAGRLARRLSLRALVGVHAARFGPELFLHQGHLEGALPAQMTWPPEGRNVDVLVAASALVLALAPRLLAFPPLVWCFALAGAASLLNIGVTSVVSLSHPLRDVLAPTFEVGLEVATFPPYVLLPGFLLQAAVCGHCLLFRRLLIREGGGEKAGELV